MEARDKMNEKSRTILVVEDEAVNREMLCRVLQESYDVICAESGREALDRIEAGGGLSLVLLDLNLPDIHGMEILRRLRSEGILDRLPVIVLTSDREAEVASLDIGATDFIPKPYPKPEVVQARVRRTIELAEGRMIIGQTERDSVTGLYNREYFYRYAEKSDILHPDAEMDAMVVNINHFHMINERYGRDYADEVLKRIGEKLGSIAEGAGGMACRRDADTFLVYCPHRSDYTDILDIISDGASGEGRDNSIVRLRMGVYPKADRSIDIERRFDRAKMAADTVRSTFTKAVAIYDNALHESAIFAEQLLIDFPKAIEEKQFQVYYQPKYDIRGDDPILSSAEALVRWEHPDFGMISPGIFIELFEKNGLIQQLDSYVWREAARQMREWKDRLGITVPVSVNVSRVDMFDPDIISNMRNLVNEFGLNKEELMLEVTESAYTEDSSHIISTVESFRDIGFFIEMDDFGSGYSSLNMLSNLPIDALKLDMQFIRSAFKNGKNTRMLEIVIEIADSLNVPVIAEGVETAEQMFTLKHMGCDIVQGYYFSKPVPAEKFEEFLIEKRDSGGETKIIEQNRYRKLVHDRHTYEAMHDPLTGLYNSSVFDILIYDADEKHTALILVDVDGYDEAVRREGRGAADNMILRTSVVLKDAFRASDFVCRIRSDEFGIILPRVDSSQHEFIDKRLAGIREKLANPVGKAAAHDAASSETRCELPSVIISTGVAFGDADNDAADLFQAADMALSRSKKTLAE